ncbi:MAG TPA: T9SS type A sorting domain-containing protein [Candidatus Kapabacteria bacterium]|nr:T9SS type A sorting domain-containing protein [Candidatus Kapabacteria bacterium]
MSPGIFSRHLLLGSLAAAAILALLGSGSASAQRFESVFGSPGCVETGLHGVLQRAGGGYVAVGESFVGPGGACMATSDAYVVVANGAGAIIWSATYQIGTNSRATDVLELPNGHLIVCGYCTIGAPCHPAPTEDIFVLDLFPNGAVSNRMVYGGDNSDEEAWQIIRATVGDGVTTFAGDYVIAGSSTNQNVGANRGAYLLRITPALNLIWDRQYGTANFDDYFYGLDEVPNGLGGAGDIVATGGSNTNPPALGTDIFTVRVNGNNGTIGAAPQGQSWTNFPPAGSNEEGRSIIVLRNGPFAGDLVVAGYTTGAPAPSTNEEAFVVEYSPNPCTQVANRYFGDNGANPDRATNLVEDANPAVAQGDVVVTGFTTFPGHGLRDVFLQRVSVGPGMALAGPAGLFGGNGIDQGGSVDNANGNPPGYIVNGFTQSPNLIGADPRQLYLIKTDLALTTACSINPNLPNGIAGNGTVCGQAIGPFINQQCQPQVGLIYWQWWYYVCPPPGGGGGGNPPNGNQLGGDGGNDGAAGVESSGTLSFNEGSVKSYPNPLAGGDVLNLRFDMKAAAAARIVVSDVAGREMYGENAELDAGSRVLPVSTQGWPTGSYMVRVAIGGVSTTARIMVLKK